MKHTLLLCTCVLCLLAACKSKLTVAVPEKYDSLSQAVKIFPDYTDVTVPPNIAPLNFRVEEPGTAFVAVVESGRKPCLVVGGSRDGKISFDEAEWRSLLKTKVGKTVYISIFVERDGRWVRYPKYALHVAQEEIDPYLSYRLIEPGYEFYRQLGLYQRNITAFDTQIIYENNREFSDDNHCVNCHNYQNNSTRNMLFHVRANHGGTIVAHDGRIQKMNLKSDSILSAAVYPSWHPSRRWVAFSTNKTGQAFHILNSEKVEVMDSGSDLVFYDAEKQTIASITRTDDVLETFPAWNPSGTRLYYCSLSIPELPQIIDSLRWSYFCSRYDNLRYDVMSLSFDPATQQFGFPQKEVDCVAMGKSASVPRISPDGNYLLFTLGDYGQFHIWHKSSDLYVKNLKTGEVYPLTEANSPDVDSYHSWSSNGRWIAFSSRRDDGSYTRIYIAYFDKKGRARKAFMIPQEDPELNDLLLKSYNVPELTKDKVPYTADDFKRVIYGEDPQDVKYKSEP